MASGRGRVDPAADRSRVSEPPARGGGEWTGGSKPLIDILGNNNKETNPHLLAQPARNTGTFSTFIGCTCACSSFFLPPAPPRRR